MQKAVPQDGVGEKSIYIFILCHVTKRGICADSGHRADAAMPEAVACTGQTWTPSGGHGGCTQRSGGHVPGWPWELGADGDRRWRGHASRALCEQLSEVLQRLSPKRCFRKTSISSRAPTEESRGQRSTKATTSVAVPLRASVQVTGTQTTPL